MPTMLPMAMVPILMPPPMEPIHTLLPMLPELLVLPQLPSPLLLELMLELADMLPTAPELSMLPRERLRLSPRLMLMPTTTVPTVMVPSLPTDTEATDMDTHMPTMERDLLMLSQRLMLTMEFTDTALPPMPMVDTEPTVMVPTLDTTGDKWLIQR